MCNQIAWYGIDLQDRKAMNIVVLNDFAHVDGGASKIALSSSKALAARGHHVILFTAVGPIDPSLLGVSGLDVRCLHQPDIADEPIRLKAVTRGLWNRTAEEQFKRCLAALEPTETVVHLHTWTKALTSSVIRAATDLGFPVVMTMHDYFSVCPSGSFFIHPKQSICHLKPMSAACIATNCDSRNYGHKLWRVGRQLVQSHLGRLPSRELDYISISDLSEEVLAPLLPAGVRVHRVPNFIDVEERPAADVATKTVFSFAGRLSPEKGPKLLAECARQLGLDVSFIGDGPLREELTKLAPNATFTGWVSVDEAREAMRRSRALVFTSVWYETQGLVVAEAIAMGIPVIVPSTSSACEWVEDNVTGLIFEGGNVADLGRKIVFLRDNPDAAAAMGREAYRRFWKRPATLSRHCQELEDVYRQMLMKVQPIAFGVPEQVANAG